MKKHSLSLKLWYFQAWPYLQKRHSTRYILATHSYHMLFLTNMFTQRKLTGTPNLSTYAFLDKNYYLYHLLHMIGTFVTPQMLLSKINMMSWLSGKYEFVLVHYIRHSFTYPTQYLSLYFSIGNNWRLVGSTNFIKNIVSCTPQTVTLTCK